MKKKHKKQIFDSINRDIVNHALVLLEPNSDLISPQKYFISFKIFVSKIQANRRIQKIRLMSQYNIFYIFNSMLFIQSLSIPMAK